MADTLVIQTAFLGDVVLTTPLLNTLATEGGPVDVVVRPESAALLRGHRAVGELIVYDKRGHHRGPASFLTLAVSLRRRKYRRALLPHRSVRSAVLALSAGIPERIGFRGTAASWTYTRRVSRDTRRHEADRVASLATTPMESALDLDLGAGEYRQADQWLQEHGITGRFVTLAPGALWGTKRWPYFDLLAGRLADSIVLIGGPEDRDLAEAIVGVDPERVRSAAGQVDIRVSAAIIARASALVTNDSAPLHLAAAVGTPVVAVFGPTVPAMGFAPRGADDRIVMGPELPCRPCSSHGPGRCPLGHHRCMRDLGTESVLASLATILH